MHTGWIDNKIARIPAYAGILLQKDNNFSKSHTFAINGRYTERQKSLNTGKTRKGDMFV